MARLVPVLCALVLGPPLAAQCPPTTALRPPPGTSLWTLFGEDVAQFGDFAVVGDRKDSGPTNSTGAAYVFERHPAGGWVGVQKLLASDGQAFDNFGSSVGIIDGWIAVGAPNRGYYGAIYMFQRQGTAWVETQKLVPVGGSDQMGRDLDLSGTILEATHGRATRYRLEGTLWVKAHPYSPLSNHGPAVSRDGPTRVLFGGATPHLYLPFQESWTFPTGSPVDGYSRAVSLSGSHVAISHTGSDSPVLNAGVVHTYRENPAEDTWDHTATLESPNPTVNGKFGSAVVVDGQRLFVGAPHEGAGRVYVFRNDAVSAAEHIWTLTAVIEPIDPMTYGEFGFSISVEGTRVLVGARGISEVPSAAYFFTVNEDGVLLDDDESDPGSRYCFDQPCPCGNDGACTGCINSTGSGALLSATGTTSVLADDLRLVASGCPPNNSAIFFAGDTAFVPAVVIRDGLGCVGGFAVRYSGTVVDGQGTVELQNVGSNAPQGFITPGVTRNFQCWYRDANCGPPPSPCSSPCGGNVNLTNAYQVTFTP